MTIQEYCEAIITGVGGLHDFEYHEMASPVCHRDVAIATWVIRCLGNGGDEAGAVVDEIVARRAQLAKGKTK